MPLQLTPKMSLRGDQVIVLSVFDGVGTGILAVQQLIGEPRLALAWEIDPAAQKVVAHRLPFVRNRGDFLEDSTSEVIRLVHRHDPHQQCILLFLSAPPCPDFSSINDSAKGFAGQEGCKFDKYLIFVDEIEKGLSEWTSIHVCENVVMQTQAEIQHVSRQLKAEPILIDAADLGIISRPRLWWTRHQWSGSDIHPISGEKLRWGRAYRIPRLFMDMPLTEEHDLDLDGYRLPGVISRHEKRLPCLTTPAPTPEGRPPPKKLRGKMDPEVRSRWLEDHRRFAPWHYSTDAMLTKDGDYIVPEANHKDQLQGFERGYTDAPGVSEHDRHRLLGNAWHLQVIRLLLMILLQASKTEATLVASHTYLSRTPPETALQFVCRLSRHDPPCLGTIPPFRTSVSHRQADDLWDHWQMSMSCIHPLLEPPSIEPGASQALTHCHNTFSDLDRLRKEVVDDIEHMVTDWGDFTADWMSHRPAHVQEVYMKQNRNSITQVPVFLQLLEDTGFPSMQDVVEDMTLGFALTGVQHAGPGWPRRQDEKYSHPLTDQQFGDLNNTYIHTKLKKAYVDPHWRTMLDEVLTEHQKGRMVGPFQAPASWPCQTVTVDNLPLLPAPDHHVYASVSFSVEQQDKIRRCEDFRRSWHNACMVAYDAPIHHGVDYYVQLCRWHAQHGHTPEVWVHDLDAAYRQIPVRDVDKAYMILQTPSGPSLWRHNALCFGAAASVWNFNRFADLLQWLARRLLWIPAHHYVDDFAAVESATCSQSGFDCFYRAFGVLGLQMKAKKALAPSTTQKLLGVIIQVTKTHVILQPCPARVNRLTTQIQAILQAGLLPANVAQKLAGKLVFLQATCFGQVGRALLIPLFARAHSEHKDKETEQLNDPLRTSLNTLLRLLQDMPPRAIPLYSEDTTTSLYTDAFFQLGDTCIKPFDTMVPRTWQPGKAYSFSNGWGFVLRTEAQTLCAHGVIPPSLLRPYGRRRAFIYVLELMAPVIAMVALHHHYNPFLVLWIDNRARLSAMSRGYGRDPSVNNLLTFAWSFLARVGVFLQCEWVASRHNLADGISRHDLSDMRDGAWKLLQLPMEPFYRILKRCADDTGYAASQAVDDALQWASTLTHG